MWWLSSNTGRGVHILDHTVDLLPSDSFLIMGILYECASIIMTVLLRNATIWQRPGKVAGGWERNVGQAYFASARRCATKKGVMIDKHESTTKEIQGPVKKGRIMALDLGEKRIGVALSDETHMLARTHSVIKRSSRKEDFRQLGAIAATENVTSLLVGLPIHLDGTEGALAAWVRDYTADLAAHLNLPYQLWDESFTTKEARASMHARGKRPRRQRNWIDAVAAAMLLQGYLDAGNN